MNNAPMRRLAGLGSALVVLGATGALAAGGLAAPGAVRVPPRGATAVCADGTYSFSQTRSGTCSHHGGVGRWLTPSGDVQVDVGATVLLARRTKTSGCKLGPNPDRRCSPGAYSSGLTRTVLCSSSFHTSTIRNVPDSERHAVEIEYGLQPRGYGSTLEIDHIVSLELGGSNSIANLYPERAPGYHLKDKLENRLHDMVCSGRIALRAAQTGIARNWQGLYVDAFGSTPHVRR